MTFDRPTVIFLAGYLSRISEFIQSKSQVSIYLLYQFSLVWLRRWGTDGFRVPLFNTKDLNYDFSVTLVER
jgi:hypothetical protein